MTLLMRCHPVVKCLAVLLGLLLGLAWGYLSWSYRPRPFTPQAWATADYKTRGCMVRDLLASRRLEGMTRQEVEQLLGPGPYWVGSAGELPFLVQFSYQLHMEYDKKGKVKKVSLDD